MSDYKGTQFKGGPVNQHKALAMGLNPDVGADGKSTLAKKDGGKAKAPKKAAEKR